MSTLGAGEISKVRLLGKRATNREVAAAVYKALKGDGIAPPKKKAEVAAAFSLSRPTVDKYLKLAEAENLAATPAPAPKVYGGDWEGNPYMRKWIDHMKTRSRSGRPFGGTQKHLNAFRILCKTLNVSPETWIAGATHDEVLEQGRALMRNFVSIYMEGKAAVHYPKGWRADRTNPASIAYHYAKTARDFMKIMGYSYPSGEPGIMSQSAAVTHGQYADVRIPDDVHAAIKKALMQNGGLDSDDFRFYVYGMEAFPRFQALYNAPSAYKELTLKNGRTVFEMEVFESKTSHYKKGIWKKHIFDRDLQDSIRRVAKRSDHLIENRAQETYENHIRKRLKALYREHGLTRFGRKFADDPESSYFLTHAVHALRHAGAQRLLKATNWNLAYVAARGWKKTQELIDSYGEMPAEVELAAMEMVA